MKLHTQRLIIATTYTNIVFPSIIYPTIFPAVRLEDNDGTFIESQATAPQPILDMSWGTMGDGTFAI